MFNFISEAVASPAVAQTAPPPSSGGFSLIMMIAIFVMFYFMILRPQQKRAKAHRDLMGQIKKGDEVLTAAGILGKVTHIGEQYIKLSIAEGVEITIQKAAINTILPKGTLKSL